MTAISDGINVVFDNTRPLVSSITQVSNNADVTRAKTGDVVTVSFTSNEDLYNLSDVKVSGQTVDAALITKTSGTVWSYDYVMSETDPEEEVHFTFTVNDLTGNSSTYVGSNTVAQLVNFDRTIPTLTPVLISSNNGLPT